MPESWESEFQEAITSHDGRCADIDARRQNSVAYLTAHLPEVLIKIAAALAPSGRQVHLHGVGPQWEGAHRALTLEVVQGEHIEFRFHPVVMDDGRVGYFSRCGVATDHSSDRYGPFPFGRGEHRSADGRGSADDIVAAFMSGYSWGLKQPNKKSLGTVAPQPPTAPARVGFVVDSTSKTD
jgi:hypothetical protein